jgi:tetratricopeptide (TPR) repeat protein
MKPHALHFNNRGLANYHIGKYEEAKRDFDEALKKSTDDPFVYFNRGNVFMNQKDFDAAHADFDMAIAKDPK